MEMIGEFEYLILSSAARLGAQAYGASIRIEIEKATSRRCSIGALYTTLDRLEGKDCVERNRKVWPHLFRATIARGDLIGRQLQNTADKLCEGELQPLLSHLVKNKKLSDAERRELRNLLDQLDDSQD